MENQIDYSALIRKRFEDVILSEFRKTPEFAAMVQAKIQELNISEPLLNLSLNAAVARGISTDVALDVLDVYISSLTVNTL